MEIKGKQKLRELVEKVGLARLVLIVLAGILLLVLSLPTEQLADVKEVKEENTEEITEGLALNAMQQYAKNQEKKTEEILSEVEGIGKVKVMLTLATSEEKITLQDSNVSDDDSDEADQSGGTRKTEKHESSQENVLVQSEGEESPYVVQLHSPDIEGVVVVAQGVNSSEKEREIIEAIQALFPIEPHKIKVMKME